MTATIPLGRVVEVSAGQPAPKPNELSKHGHPFIRAGSLEGLINSKTENDCERIDDATAETRRLKLYPVGTVLFAKSGMSSRIGRVYRLREPSFVVSHLAALSPTGKYDPSYLTYWLQMNPPSQLIRDQAYPSIRTSEIAAIEVPDIAVDEQRRIAGILDKADAIRRKREQSLAHADELLKSVFLEMFGDPASNQKNFPVTPIKNIGRVITGNTPPRKNPENYGQGIEWIKSGNINTPHHVLTEAEETLSDKGQILARTVPAGATLVTCIAGSPNSIGNAALANREVAFNQQINAVVPSPDVNPYFLYFQFRIAKQLVQGASTNSMKGMVSKGKFQEIRFIYPPEKKQREFGLIFEAVVCMTQRTNAALNEGETFFSSLSQRAFLGEL